MINEVLQFKKHLLQKLYMGMCCLQTPFYHGLSFFLRYRLPASFTFEFFKKFFKRLFTAYRAFCASYSGAYILAQVRSIFFEFFWKITLKPSISSTMRYSLTRSSKICSSMKLILLFFTWASLLVTFCSVPRIIALLILKFLIWAFLCAFMRICRRTALFRADAYLMRGLLVFFLMRCISMDKRLSWKEFSVPVASEEESCDSS